MRLSPTFLASKPPEEGGYVAPAVHFDAATVGLFINSLTATDSANVGFAYWMRIPVALTAANSIWVADPLVNYNDMNTGAFPADGKMFARLTDDAHALTIKSSIAFPTLAWTCVICALDGATGDAKVYFGDTDVSGTKAFSVAVAPVFNGLSFSLGDDTYGDGPEMDMADFRWASNQNWLSGGDIPLATRRLFIDADGKPVDPAVATAALGAPCILFSGDASTFGTNQGTGGAFTLTGSLTNASTSPSDDPPRLTLGGDLLKLGTYQLVLRA